MANTIKYDGGNSVVKNLRDCHSVVHNATTTEVHIDVNYKEIIYDIELVRRWLKIITLIDKKFKWKEENSHFIIDLFSKDYASIYDMYVTFIMVRWIWMYKGALPEVFRLRETTKMIWFKCAQAMHNFKVMDSKFIGSYNNFYQGMDTYRRQFFTYKEFVALPKSPNTGLNRLWDKYYKFDGTSKTLLKDIPVIETLEVTADIYKKIETKLATCTDKLIYIYVSPNPRVAGDYRDGILMVKTNDETKNPSYLHYKSVIDLKGSTGFTLQKLSEDREYTNSGLQMPDRNCATIEFKNVKIKK